MNFQKNPQHITLIGGGIMSATLGILLHKMFPTCEIDIFERLPQVAQESSNAWNNAGTGHAAYCELNYTPETEDGRIDISKALKIVSAFELSKSFWANAVQKGYFSSPESFINNIPHISFVWGKENVSYLKKRFDALSAHPLFQEMCYSEDPHILQEWMPLVMENRDLTEPVAATKVGMGTDVNFGKLSVELFNTLSKSPNINLHLLHEVQNLHKTEKGQWEVTVHDLSNDESRYYYSDFVFIGAGGGTLPLLDNSDIVEAKGFGGFPVGGQWLRCTNPKIIAQHEAKVYGKAALGAPPMSVPHLDTRFINGEKALLFGPFAGFSTKFLKNGSYFDLPLSIELDNVMSMLGAGWHNIPLTQYLMQQVLMSHEDKMNALRAYFPNAKSEDWQIEIAGQRVQVIQKDEEEGGKLAFGTEIVTSADGTIAGLLGASPGASTAVYIMTEVLKKCFPYALQNPEICTKLQGFLPNIQQAFSAQDWLNQRIKNNHILHLDT